MLSITQGEHMFELKYRPQTLEECILPQADKEIFEGIISKGKIPHMILQSDSPGTGKTTIAKVLCNAINAEVMFKNGSDCKIDDIRNDLTRFATSLSMDNKPKVIILDEFDRPGLGEAQRLLRGFMEAHAHNCSIIITANNLDGIIKPIQSRSHVVQFGQAKAEDVKTMMVAMVKRCKAICDNENITVDAEGMKVLATLVKKNFPDFRKTVNMLDHYSSKGVIDAGILSQVTQERNSIDEVVNSIKSKDLKGLRANAARYATEYPIFVDKLSNALYEELKPQGKLTMYEIVGENNQFVGLAANLEVHIIHMFARLMIELKGEWV